MDLENANACTKLWSVLLGVYDLLVPQEEGPHTNLRLTLRLGHDTANLSRHELKIYLTCHHHQA
jgi:hypothetical protein